MDKPISRKRALALYRDALERGDFDTVAAVLWLAERDPKLVHMIAKFHETVDAPVTADAKPRRGIVEVVRINPDSSPNGWPPKPDQNEEEPNMFTTFVPARSPYYSGARKLKWNLIIGAAAILLVAVLGLLLLLFMRSPQGTMPEFATQPESCVAEGQNPQEESVRLAGEAHALITTPDLTQRRTNAELATSLAACALQTTYTPEADEALQEALSLTDALQRFEGHTWYVNGLAFSTDGQYLYSGSADTTIRVWDIHSRTEMTRYQANHMVFYLALSPDGRYLVTGEWSATAEVRDIQTGEVVRTFTDGGSSAIVPLIFSSDGKYLLTGNQRGLLKLWDFSTGEELQTYNGKSGGAMSSDGRYVATIDDGQIHLYNVGESEPIAAIDFTLPPELWGTFSPDGRYLLLSGGTVQRSSDNNTQSIGTAPILLLDRETGAEVRRFEGHTGQVYADFSPDGKYVLSTSYDGTTRVWDAETGEQLRIFTNQLLTVDQGEAVSAALSSDERQVAIGYETGMVVMWPTDYHDMITLACEHVSRDFTAEERAQYGLGEGAACP